MPARLYVDAPLQAHTLLTLPPDPSRHVQVLRLQPGADVTLFNGEGGEWHATVQHMGRSEVGVLVGEHQPVQRELALRVSLALCMPANERMDLLVEKATELGAAAIQPLMSERSVLRLSGERAAKKVAHWRGVAIAASEQSGRTQVPVVEPVRTLADWLRGLPIASGDAERRLMLSLRTGPLLPVAHRAPAVFLSGPEGGFTPDEEALATRCGFEPVSLGRRVLRADTAPLAALAALALAAER